MLGNQLAKRTGLLAEPGGVMVKCLPHHDEEEERKKKRRESLDPAGHSGLHAFALTVILEFYSYSRTSACQENFGPGSRASKILRC